MEHEACLPGITVPIAKLYFKLLYFALDITYIYELDFTDRNSKARCRETVWIIVLKSIGFAFLIRESLRKMMPVRPDYKMS